MSLVASQDLVDAVRAEGVVEEPGLTGLEQVEGEFSGGRGGLKTVWTL